MNLTNYTRSVEKWKNLIATIEKAIKEHCHVFSWDLVDPCGFCKEFNSKETRCSPCPLFPVHCAPCPTNDGAHSLFWRIINALDYKEYEEALKLSKEMLTAIESFKHLWDEAKE